MKDNQLICPTKNDWGDISNNDINYSFEYFGGKTNQEMQNEFKKNVIERCENLRHMPLKVSKYYIFGFSDYIKFGDFGLFNKPDSVSCFLNITHYMVKKFGHDFFEIYQTLRPQLQEIVTNQIYYDADVEDYGDFSKILEEIDLLFK